jgi:type IV pilus assembly protein PilM
VSARRAVGLDIGTSGVRAAQLRFGKDGVSLERFGQVALPVGVVRDGEVTDPHSVAGAIKQLWSQAKFTTNKVTVGVANQKVVVRQVDLPWMPLSELRATLQFHVQDIIPIPIDQAILDIHPLEEVSSDSGARLQRVLLVAASRDMIDGTMAAVTGAGLEPVTIDLTPFAVLRALAEPSHLGLSSQAEALVDVGASVTNIIVHEGGVPRFVRILLLGGNDITEAVAERMGVPVEQAELVKQQMGMPEDVVAAGAHPASRVLEAAGSRWVEEVRGSLDYYMAQSGATRLSRIVLSGGGGQLRGLVSRLTSATRIPVVAGSPMPRLSVGKTGLSPEQLQYIQPLVTVPVGLAMGEAA